MNFAELSDTDLQSFITVIGEQVKPNQQKILLLSLTHGFVLFFLWTVLGLF